MTRNFLAIGSLAVGALFAFTPFAHAGKSKAPAIQIAELDVLASNDEWTDSKLQITSGDVIATEVRGKYNVGWGASVYSDTSHPCWNRDCPGIRPGISPGNVVMKIGDGATIKPQQQGYQRIGWTGPMKFKIHDTDYADNKGSVHVVVRVIPAALWPLTEADTVNE